MKVSVHQPHYLPWLGYLEKIARSDLFVFLDRVQFKKREFQNRNKILTDAGPIWLTVPVRTKGRYLQEMRDVEIDNETDWRRSHREQIRMAYRRQPHYGWVMERLDRFYDVPHEKLSDMNIAMVRMLCDLFSITTPLRLESEIGTTTDSTARLVEIVSKVGGTVYLSGAGGKDYMDESLFAAANLALEYQHFVHPAYEQRRNRPFEPYLCAYDLLFAMGPASRDILLPES